MECSRWILVRVVLFQLRGHGHPQGDATPNFFPDSKSSILGLSNEVSFISRFFQKISEHQEKEGSITWLNVSNWGEAVLSAISILTIVKDGQIKTSKTLNLCHFFLTPLYISIELHVVAIKDVLLLFKSHYDMSNSSCSFTTL